MKRFVWLAVVLVGMAEAKCDVHAQKLVSAYSQITACRNNHIVWSDGTKMVYDDGKAKTKEKILKHADIEDMFSHSYTREHYKNPQHDPGRYRNEKFFRKMYGNSASQVRRHLTTIDWFGRKVRVTMVNRVNRHLLNVEHELKGLLKSHPEYRKYLEKDSALERRFQPIQVEEPTVADTIKILEGLIAGLLKIHANPFHEFDKSFFR